MPRPQRPVLKLKRKEDRGAGRGKSKKSKDIKNSDSRWSKGHSCESNPSVRKFRDGVSNLHFQLHPVGKNPLLTVGNLEYMQEDEMEDDYDVLSDDVRSLTVSDARTRLGSVSSYKTFASGWSKCSNQAFERFLGRFKVDSALHKDMLSILAATTEVINSLGGKHSDTEYFATFISALEGCEPSQYHPMMALVCMIIGRVSEPVIRLKFKEIYSKVSSIFITALESNEHTLIRLCCDAVGKILRTQDSIAVDPDSTDNYSVYYSILKCCLHDNPKVRRKGRQVIGGLLNRHNEKQSTDLSKLVLGWILDQLISYPTCGPKVACDTLGLLQFTWSFVESINTSASKKVFESVLRVLSGGDTNILKIGFALFTSVFQKGYGLVPENKSEDDSLTPKLVSVLWDLRPDWRSNDAFMGWIRCILDGVVRLVQEGNENGQRYIPLLIEAVSPSWPSSFGQQPSQILCEYLEHVIKADTSSSVIEETFQLLSKNLIAIPPNPHCLTVLDSTLDTLLPSQFGNSSREVLLQLVPLYSSNTSEMSRTLGRFVKAFGVENLWNSVDNEAKISVILPLLRDNLCQSDFKFWKESILPLDSGDAKITMRLVVWESLVGFCRDPRSVDDFPAQIIGKTIVDRPQVRLSALAAIRQFALWPQCEQVLKKFSKNFLPLFFNLYVKEKVSATKEETKMDNPGHADAIIGTISEYLRFCDEDFVLDLLNRAIAKLSANETTEDERTPLLDLIATLVSVQLDSNALGKLLEISSTLIADSQNQKRGYRILNSLVKNEKFEKEIKDRVLQLLQANKGKAKSNAEALRLECILYLSEKDPALVNEFLPEAVLNLLSVNAKTRKLANRFASQACGQLKSLEPIIEVVEVGLKSPNNFVRACTVNFMTLAFLEIKPKHPNVELIQACIDQIRESKQPGSKRMSAGPDGSLCKESLGFLSLNLSLFKSLMGPHASAIGEVLALPGNPRKEVNRMLARMIKVFGVAGLNAVLPNSNEPKMHARIKNLQKKIRKLKEAQSKSKKLAEEDGENAGFDRGDKDGASSDESDDEFGGSSKSSKRTLNKRGLVIKEGVIDFLDPKNVTGALINKPKETKQEDQFKVSEDGKLIIEMEEEMGKGGTGRKRKAGLSESGSTASGFYDDDDDDEELDKRPPKSTRKNFNSARSTKSYSSSRSMKSNYSSKSNKSNASKRSTKLRNKKARH